jgi:hypothetical protein
MITNEKGQVAIAYHQPIPIAIKVDGVVYDFKVKRGVALIWAEPQHVGKILSITKNCCNNQVHAVCRYATPSQVNVWSGTGR